MKRLLLLLPLAIFVSSCNAFDQKAQTVKACRDILVPTLLDIESYRERSEPDIYQQEPDNPVVYGWRWNSRNTMGGYTQPNQQLCYRDNDGEIVTASFGLEDINGIEKFLRPTSPRLQKKESDRLAEVAKRRQEYEAQKQKEAEARNKARREAEARANAAAAREAAIEAKHRREFFKLYQRAKEEIAKPNFINSYTDYSSYINAENVGQGCWMLDDPDMLSPWIWRWAELRTGSCSSYKEGICED